MFKNDINYIIEPYKSILKKLLNSLLFVFKDKLFSVVVYGSVARAQAKHDSDIDLLIVIDNLPKSRFERIKLFNAIEDSLEKDLIELYNKGYSITFSPIIKSPKEAQRISPLYLDMVEDAIIIYDKNGFFESILKRLLEILNKLGAERIWVGKGWYWRLKKDFKFGEIITIE